MQQAWKDFLDDNTLNSDVDVKESAIISPLSDFTLLAVTGEDRHRFLHGQFINDLNLIKSPAAQLSAWCNPKGQVISNFIIINTGISYLLVFKQELQDTIQKRLTMFVLRSDVKIEDISETSPLVGFANINNLSALSDNIPENAGDVHASDGLIIISYPDNSGRYLVTGTVEALINKLPELNTKTSDSAVWNLLDIKAGLPWITQATQEQFLPQMINLDALHGLSYQKGCYPGQEVIARLHYRGEVKKRLQLIKSGSELIIGNDIYLDCTDNKVGTVINSVNNSNFNYGLAVIELDQISKKMVSNHHKIEILKLPY